MGAPRISDVPLICTEVGAIAPEMSYLIIREQLGWELEEELMAIR